MTSTSGKPAAADLPLIDLAGYNQVLAKYHGKPLSAPTLRTERKTAGALRSPFSFARYGKSGIEVSELFARTAKTHIDDLCHHFLPAAPKTVRMSRRASELITTLITKRIKPSSINALR